MSAADLLFLMSAMTALLEHAARRVPRYRGLPPALETFPIATKRAILADMAAYLSDEIGGPERERLISCLFDETRSSDSKFESVFNSQITIEETSGSSGIPFRIPKTMQERKLAALGIWRYRRRYDPQVTLANFYPFIHEPRGFVSKGNPYDLLPENVARIYTELTAGNFRWVHGEPRLLRWHAERVSERDRDAATKTVRFAESSGQRVSPEDRAIIESQLNVTLIDQYGSREAWAMGTRQDDGAFEVVTDNVLIELLTPDNQPVTEPDQAGRVAVTCLHQRLLPFIRYETGDMGTWESGGVGRKLRLLEMREHNLLRLSGRELNGNEFFKNMLFLAFNEIGHANLSYVQVRQLGEKQFVLATSRSPQAEKLCAAVERISCNDPNVPFPRDAVFSLLQLDGTEIEQELLTKQSLFTTRFMRAS
jgi:phenylacetate-CoA ligase